VTQLPPADIDLAKIGDLLNCDLAAFLKNAACDGKKPPKAANMMALVATPTGSADVRAILIVAGVSGSGKTTIATALAQRLGLPFEEGDQLHPPPDIAKSHSPIRRENRGVDQRLVCVGLILVGAKRS
jgi:hypothetical protein